jgi:signal transduction histidine kinase/CheY-like chemotaxis protein
MYCVDITERIRAEEKVRSLARFPDENPNPVLRVHSAGELIYFNAEGQELVDHWAIGIGQSLPARLVELTAKAIEAKSSQHVDELCGARTFRLEFSPIDDAEYLNIYARDITTQLAAEASLRGAYDELKSERAVLKGANLELSILHDVSDILVRSGSLEEVLDPIVSQLGRVLNGATPVLFAKAPTSREWLRSKSFSTPWCESLPSLYEPTADSSLAIVSKSEGVRLVAPVALDDALEALALRSGHDFVTSIAFSSDRSEYVLQLFSAEDHMAFNAQQAFRIVAFRLTAFLASLGQREQEQTKTRAQVQMLTHAAESAVEKNRQKTQYLAQVNHDIRTPMNAILGMSELLLGTDLDPKQADYAGIVRDSTRALLGVINSSLDLARIEAGRLTLASTPFDLHSLVENCAYLFAQQAQSKGVALTWKISQDVPRGMRGDGERLRQILANVLGNAVKFTEQGAVTLNVGLVERKDQICRLSIAVEDTGRGIPSLEIEQVLEPFTQSESGSQEGSGLGLAIVKAFANLMDSEVELTSTVGTGTKIALQPQLEVDPKAGAWQPPSALRELSVVLVSTPSSMLHEQLRQIGCRATVASDLELSLQEGDVVIIDLNEDAATRGELAQSISDHLVITVGGEELQGIPHVIGWPPRERALAECLSEERFDSTPTNRIRKIGGRILIVDDSALNRRLVAEFSTLWGLEFDEAENGANAVTMWEQNSYDLIVMDCQMPILDGLAATTEIRRREPPGQHIPILALTAHAMASDVAKCTAAGMDDYLSKPLTPETLRRKISQLIFDGDGHGDKPTGSGQVSPVQNATTVDDLSPTNKIRRRVSGAGRESDTASATVSSETEAQAKAVDELVWNRLVDLQNRSGDSLLEDIVGMYGTQSKELSKQIREALVSNEQEVVQRCAHRLKGTAGSIGATRVEQLCQKLEEAQEPSLVLCDELEEAVAQAHQTLLGRLR